MWSAGNPRKKPHRREKSRSGGVCSADVREPPPCCSGCCFCCARVYTVWPSGGAVQGGGLRQNAGPGRGEASLGGLRLGRSRACPVARWGPGSSCGSSDPSRWPLVPCSGPLGPGDTGGRAAPFFPDEPFLAPPFPTPIRAKHGTQRHWPRAVSPLSSADWTRGPF